MTHVVVTRNFAGVEQYVAYVAPVLAALGAIVTVVGGAPGPMKRLLAGTNVVQVPARGLAGAALAIVRSQPDVIHAHMTLAEMASMAGRQGSARIVSTRHFAAARGSHPVTRRLSPWIARRITQQVAISEYVATAIGEPCRVIPNGVPCAPLGSHDAREILVAQRFEKEKETVVALEAWAASGLQQDGWRLTVAGRGSGDHLLRARAVSLGIEESVSFVGFVDDIASRLARVGALLATAPAEPFGLTVVEAMARGTPVIAAAGGAHIETVGGATNRWLFPPGDADSCAQLLKKFAAEGSSTEAYGNLLQERQRAEYSIDLHARRLLELYAEVAGATG